MKRGTARHPKVFALCEEMNIERPMALGYLQLLWEFAAEFAPDGNVGKYPHSRIEAAMDFKGRGYPKGKLIEALVKTKWLDLDSERKLTVHDWIEHCEKSVHRRLQRNQSHTQKMTPQNGVTDAKNEPPVRAHAFAFNHSHNQNHADASPGTDPFGGSDFAEEIYRAHPNKAGKILFQQTLAGKLSDSTDSGTLAERIRRAHAAWLPVWSRDGGRYAPRLDRWIAEDRFLDADPPCEADPGPAPGHTGSTVDDEVIPPGTRLPKYGKYGDAA